MNTSACARPVSSYILKIRISGRADSGSPFVDALKDSLGSYTDSLHISQNIRMRAAQLAMAGEIFTGNF